MEINMLFKPFEMSLVFSVLGLVLFALAIWIIVKVCPFSVRKEIEDDQNIALAVIIGAIILGIALIVAAAIHGSPEAAAPAGAKSTVGWPGLEPSLRRSEVPVPQLCYVSAGLRHAARLQHATGTRHDAIITRSVMDTMPS